MKPSSPLKIIAFRRLWLGQTISQMGDSFYYVTFMFMVQRVTGSAAMVGYVGACETLPFLLFGPYAGVLADRVDRKRIMLLSDLISGAVLSGFALAILALGSPPAWLLLVIPFLLSSVRCFFMPAQSAAIPSIVPAAMLMRANSLSSTTQNAAPVLGLCFTAGVLGLLYRSSPVIFYTSVVGLNALSFFLSALFIAKLPKILPDRQDRHDTHPLADLRDGLRYIGTRHDLKLLTVLITVFRLMVAPFFVVYLAANDQWLGGKPQSIAWLEASFFCGMVISSIAMGRARPKRPLLWFSSSLAVVALTVGAMAFSPNFWLFVLWNAVAGRALPLADIPVFTYLQLSVPDGYRGRVNSVRNTIATGIMPVGMCLGGAFVARFGVAAGFLTMGVGMVVACFIGLLDRQFRNARMPEEQAEPSRASPGMENLEPATSAGYLQ